MHGHNPNENRTTAVSFCFEQRQQMLGYPGYISRREEGSALVLDSTSIPMDHGRNALLMQERHTFYSE